jgi:hypothetical protein
VSHAAGENTEALQLLRMAQSLGHGALLRLLALALGDDLAR